jgi:hypothetical protein
VSEHKGRSIERNQRDWERIQAVRKSVEAHMRDVGLDPERIPNHSLKYRVSYEGKREIWAVKVATKSPGLMGFAQKKEGEWSSPLSDTDRILHPTVNNAEKPTTIVCHLFRTDELRKRYDAIQAHYTARDRKETAALWGCVYDRPATGALNPVQVNLAKGQPPLWTLPYGHAARQPEKKPEPKVEPQGENDPRLSEATVEQMQAELRRRGMKIDSITFD